MNLTIENLTKSFGEKKALDIERYSIHSGETIGLVGNNGAGKTTLFRIILDLLHADKGCVVMEGETFSFDEKINAMKLYWESDEEPISTISPPKSIFVFSQKSPIFQTKSCTTVSCSSTPS